jgi:quercetin dioxygenase-like cupin family protein
MSWKLKLCVASAVFLAAAWIAWPQAAPDPLDSLVVCADTQHLILENAFVRVIDDSIPAGASEPLHRHRHSVVVYLTDYTLQQTTGDGQTTVTPRKAGTAAWSEAIVHSLKNVGNTPSHAIRIELKF